MRWLCITCAHRPHARPAAALVCASVLLGAVAATGAICLRALPGLPLVLRRRWPATV